MPMSFQLTFEIAASLQNFDILVACHVLVNEKLG